MKAGRNDPCPCGSGAKYKKCCLLKLDAVRQASAEADAEARQSQIERVAALDALSDFSASRSLAPLKPVARLFGLLEPLPEGVSREEVELKFYFYVHFDAPLADGRTIAETFLETDGRSLPPGRQAVLRRIAAASLRVYEVQDVRFDEGVRLLDLRSGETPWVRERLGSRQLERWDVLGARVVREDDGLVFEGGLYVVPPASKPPLLALLRREERKLERRRAPFGEDALFRHFAPILHGFWLDLFEGPPPRVVTAEGDPMVFGKVLFDVLDEAALGEALDAHTDLVGDAAEGYTWVEEAGSFKRTLGDIKISGGRLALDITSRERAIRGRALIEEAAGRSVRHRATRFESVQSAIEGAKRSPRSRAREDTVDPAEAAAILKDFKDAHYRTWPDVPLPALGGRTPRHAARLKTWRPRLIDLLKDMENHEARAATPDSPAYDFGWVWRELGLESGRQGLHAGVD